MHLKFLLPLVLLAGLAVFPANAQETYGVNCRWRLKLPGNNSDCSPAIAPDGTIYQGVFNGILLAVKPDGKVKWQFKTGREIKSSPAVAADGTIYFGARDWNFYALTPPGKLKWQFATGAWVDSSPAIAADGTIYFGGWDKKFYALNPDGSLKWKFATGNLITASPAIGADGTIYFGSHDQQFYALTPAGKMKWKFDAGATMDASPAIGADGAIYFTTTGGNFFAVNPDGTERWRLRTGGTTSSSPVLDTNGTLYLCVNRYHTAIGSNGKIRWQHIGEIPMETSAAVAANGQVYFSVPWLRIGGFDCGGEWKPIWMFQMNANLTGSPNVDAHGVVYAGDEYFLFALQPATNAAPLQKSSWPMWRANPQHTGRVEK